MSLFHPDGKNSCFSEDALLMPLQSSGQDLALEEEKVKRDDKPSPSHPFLATPRPVPKIVRKSAWQLQQQQQEQQELRGCGKPPAEQTQGTPTDNPNSRSFGKPLRRIELLVEDEEHEFKVDLRIEGNPTCSA